MTSREWMEANKDGHSDSASLVKACIEVLGLTPSGNIYKIAKQVLGASAPKPAAAKPAGLRTEAVADIVDRETLDPVAKVVETCTAMPDGELARGDDLRLYLEISKTAWADIVEDPMLTSYRCHVPKKGSASSYTVFFGNPQEVQRMKRRKGVK